MAPTSEHESDQSHYPTYAQLQAEVASLREDLQYHSDQVERDRAALRAVGGLVDGWRDVDPYAARDLLRALLSIPDERPGSHEAAHVEAIRDALQAVLAHLGGDR